MNRTTQTLLAAVTVAAAVAVSAAPVQAQPRLRHIPSSASAAAAFSPARTGVESSTLAAALAAHPVTVTPRAGDGWITLTQRTCGSSRTWTAQRSLNGGAAGLFMGRWYRIDCGLSGGSVPAAAPSSSAWQHPLPGRCVTSGYGWRNGRMHRGSDFAAPWGTPVRAVHSGTVGLGNQPSGAGLYVTVNHGDGTASTYFHLSSRAVGGGQWVAAGQVIGYVGSTGNSTGPHLHLETHAPLWVNRLDPVGFMAARGVRIGC